MLEERACRPLLLASGGGDLALGGYRAARFAVAVAGASACG